MPEPMTISRILGSRYDRPSCIEGVTYPDWTFCAAVGAAYGGEGPIVTSIRIVSDGNGISGTYDRLTVWAGDLMLFECPAWFAHIEYEHDRRENPMKDIF